MLLLSAVVAMMSMLMVMKSWVLMAASRAVSECLICSVEVAVTIEE